MGKDFKLDEDQATEYYSEYTKAELVLSQENIFKSNPKLAKGLLEPEALAIKQAEVDAEVNNTVFGARNQALGVAGVSGAAAGYGGYWAYNKWCSKKDDKPVDQKPVHQYPVNPHVPHVRTNNTAGDRTNTKTNKADKKSGMPGWAIFLIIFAIVAVIGAVVYFVFSTSKDEDEEFDEEL